MANLDDLVAAMQPSDAAAFDHLLGKCREARDGGLGYLSTGERLAAALVLNRADWLEEDQYTIVEAIDRIGPQWAGLMPRAVEELKEDHRLKLVDDDPRVGDDWRSPPVSGPGHQ